MPPEYQAAYPATDVDLPPNFLTQHPFDNGEMNIRDEWLAATPRNPKVIRKHLAKYHAMITHLDVNINKVLRALQDKGLADNTIIVFTSDNGLALGQHGLMGKQNIYEHSVQVPLIITGPGIPANVTRSGLCYLIDLYPTLCDLVGLATPATVQGKSLMPAIKSNEDVALRAQLVFAYKHFQRGIIRDRWKLMEYNVDGEKHTQLFDLIADPFETTNLAAAPEQQATARRLRRRMQKEMKASHDPVTLREPDWGVAPIPSWLERMQSNNPDALQRLIKLAEAERKQYGDSSQINESIK